MNSSTLLSIVNAHCEGVVCDVLIGGLPPIKGDSVLEKKHYFNDNFDGIRRLLLSEPRGAATQHTNVIVESRIPGVEFGMLTLEKEEIVDMSGGNIISTATVLIETGMVPKTEPVTTLKLETPAGVITLTAAVKDGRVQNVTFINGPSFVLKRDIHIDVPAWGSVRADVVWGGMWYLVLDAEDLGLQLHPREHNEIVRLGELVKTAAREQLTLEHPTEPGMAEFLQNTLIAGPLHFDGDVVSSRNAVVVSPGYIDRCPCGTGTSGRLALLRERGEITESPRFVHESLIGTKFECAIEDGPVVGEYPSVIPSVTGRAWITGTQVVTVADDDPFPFGFSLEQLAREQGFPTA